MTKIATLDGFAAQAIAKAGQEDNLVKQAKSLANNEGKTKAELEKAANGFEALLLHQMMKEMWNTVETGGLLGEDSNQAQIYRDMLNQAISESVAQGKGIGVKDFLKAQLSMKVMSPEELASAKDLETTLDDDTIEW